MIFLLLVSIQQALTMDLRSFGGREALPEEYPYVVSMDMVLDLNGQEIHVQSCTGSALTVTWTLTAAHCIMDDPMPFYKKTVLRYGPKDQPRRSNILKTVLHKNFQSSDTYAEHDIALIQSETLQLSNFARLSAVDYTTLVGSPAISAGYGIGWNDTILDILLLLRPLQVVEVMIAKCDESYLLHGLCSTSKCGIRSYLCPGDSGGPVIHQSGVVAVHTYGFHSQRAKTLPEIKGIYKFVAIDTPVSPYIDWIIGQINT